jgi:hypothetical protein
MGAYVWLLQYGVACLVVLVLGAILASSSLFQHTTFGTDQVTAADAVRALADGAALVLLWFAAARARRSLPDDGSWRSLLRATILPLATLVVLGVGYGVPLFVLRPFLSPAAMMAYRWLFVLAIIGAALWLALASFRHATVLASVVARAARSVRSAATTREATSPGVSASTARCEQCGAPVAPGVMSCRECGHPLAA